MSKITVTTIAGATSGSDANKVKIESGDDFNVVSGQVGIGTTTHHDNATKLTVAGRINTSNGTATGSMNYGGGSVVNMGALTNHPVNLMVNNSTKWVIDTNGNLIAEGGGGIVLGNTSYAAANELDDYEEGSVTPVVKYGTTTMSLHGGALGRYVKIGSSVTYMFEFRISNTNSGSGDYTLALPFAMMDGGYAVGGIRIYNGAVAGGEFLGLHQNSSTLVFNRNRNNTSTISITPTVNAYYYGSITYRTT